MITFKLNGRPVTYGGDENLNVLKYLRCEAGLTSVKDGCSEQAACGTCLVEVDGAPRLACALKMKKLDQTEVYTLEGVPEAVKQELAKAFVKKGAVQCGFCSPGMLMRAKILLQDNPSPTVEDIREALKMNLCRCTGFKKIEAAILLAAEARREGKAVVLDVQDGKVGASYPKYQALETALGSREFVGDIRLEGMLYGALKFSDHPRAVARKIDTSRAEGQPGVVAVFTAKDIPGNPHTGLIFSDWPLMIAEGQTTHYIGDVLAGVVAEDEETARRAVALIDVEYDVLSPITDVLEAAKEGAERVHSDSPNVLENCAIKRGDINTALANSAFTCSGAYQTQPIEHGFLELECAVARPTPDGGVELFSQGQGVYEDRRQVAALLGLPEEKAKVKLVSNGGGFGGKEDLSVQGHAALFAYLLQRPVRVALTREESICMHPKRHPLYMEITLGCDENGRLTALQLRAWGDTGAYASVGTKVMERVAGHASAGYYVPVIDLEARTVYTNNIPAGAMRGFGANQVAFAMESCVDELCEKGGFDRWQFRYDNALVDGLKTATGQVLQGVGIRACLLALKEEFYNARYAGLACAIKNSGIGNGMVDESTVRIEVLAPDRVVLHHGWTEMGQGVHTMALQTLCQETGIDPAVIEVRVDTRAGLGTGMTTASRGTALVGNAVIDAAKGLRVDLKRHTLSELAGKTYAGQWKCDWTNKPGTGEEGSAVHYSYGYAAQLCVLNKDGEIETLYAAHDAGKVMNPVLFEGQIEGAVHMGIGYALSESLPMEGGRPLTTRLRHLGILKAHQTPEIVVKTVEVKDPYGPYGAKGVGEIGLVPTAPAIANALYQFDGVRRRKLPLQREKYVSKQYV
ncbi:MAG: selenium-dependent xanthine dehydrogenase [Lewinellaceae bacterium]|nr:selenium-dependent xanthine dehydrogenase [Lewinellaceae bacterium]